MVVSPPHTKKVQGDKNLMNHYIIWLLADLCKWSFCVIHKKQPSVSVCCIKVTVQERETSTLKVHSFYFLHFLSPQIRKYSQYRG